MVDQLDSLQPVIWKRSFRAKYMSLRLKSDGTLLVTIPFLKSPKSAIPFVLEKKDWIIRTREKLNTRLSNLIKHNAQDLPALRKQAKRVLGARMDEFAQLYDFNYKGMRLQWMKSRWGSCSSANSISLNLALMHLPTELQDYVILHELCHTKVKNHSKQFWSLLDTYTDNRAKELSKQIKEYKIGEIEP